MKPILFNTDMVRAILNNRKTVTRRVVKIEHLRGLDSYEATTIKKNCVPPYCPGDILYVRETWAHPSGIEIKNGADPQMYLYKADVFQSAAWDKWCPSIHMPREAARIFLRVTDVRVERLHEFGIEDAKKEGVVPISRPGGCRCQWAYDGCMEEPCPNRAAYEIERHVDPFVKVWDRTIRPTDRDLYGWLANPWVWVIEFERITKEEAG